MLEYYELPDVKSTRGGVAQTASPGRKAQRGMVMRNGVADKVAASGTVMARLARRPSSSVGGRLKCDLGIIAYGTEFSTGFLGKAGVFTVG